MKLKSLAILFISLGFAGCSTALHFPKTNVIVHHVSLSEVTTQCGKTQLYGCAKWYRFGEDCNIYINRNLTASLSQDVLEHEQRHCTEGKFHKE